MTECLVNLLHLDLLVLGVGVGDVDLVLEVLVRDDVADGAAVVAGVGHVQLDGVAEERCLALLHAEVNLHPLTSLPAHQERYVCIYKIRG